MILSSRSMASDLTLPPVSMLPEYLAEGGQAPAFTQGLPDQLGLRLRRQSVDGLVAVEIGRKGVALGRSRDHIADRSFAGTGRQSCRQHWEQGTSDGGSVDRFHGTAEGRR